MWISQRTNELLIRAATKKSFLFICNKANGETFDISYINGMIEARK
jgi:hypothetical protein